MSSQSFEYDLVIRVAQAESRIAELATRIGDSLDNATSKISDNAKEEAEKLFSIMLNTAKRIGSERMAEEEKLSKAILDIQINTAKRAGQEWSKHYDKLAELASRTAGGSASNAGYYRAKQRAAEIKEIGEQLRSTFTDNISQDMISKIERSLRATSAKLKDLGLEESVTRWEAAKDKATGGFNTSAARQRMAEEKRLADHADDLRMRSVRLASEEWSKAHDKAMSDEQRRHEQRMENIRKEQAAQERAAEEEFLERARVSREQIQQDLDSKEKRRKGVAQAFDDDDREKAKELIRLEKERRELEQKNEAARKKGVQDHLDAVETGQRRIKGEETQLDEDYRRRMENRARITKAFRDSDIAGISKISESNDKAYARQQRDLDNLSRADAIRYDGLNRYETALTARHAATRRELQVASDQREAMGEQWFRNELRRIQMLASAERDKAIRIAGAQTNTDLAAFSGGGRTVSNMFQIQQAFEDAQYAGLRGAANNIAMMAANLGGNTGIVALVGIMGAQAATSLGLWDKLNESLGGFLWKLEAVTKEQEKQIALAAQLASNWEKNAATIWEFDADAAGDLELNAEKKKDEIQTLQDITAQLHVAQSAYESMASAANQLDTAMPRGWLGPLTSSPEESAEVLDYYQETIAESERGLVGVTLLTEGQRQYARETLTTFEAAQRLWEANSFGAPLTEAGYEAIVKKVTEYEAKLVEANSELETTLWLMKNLKSVYDELEHVTDKQFKKAEVFSSKGMKDEVKENFEENTAARLAAVEAVEEDAQSRIKLLQVGYAADIQAARERGDLKEEARLRNELAKAIRAQIDRIVEARTEALEDADREWTAAQDKMELYEKVEKLHESTTEAYKEQTAEIEKQYNNTQRLIDADKERLKVLEDQLSAFEDQAGKQAVQLQAKQAEHEGKLESEAYKERARLGKESFKQWVDQQKEMARQAEQFELRTNAKGKGDNDPDKAVREKYARWRNWFDSYVGDMENRADAADRHNLERIERQAELEAKAKFKEYDDAQRIKLKKLEDEAAQAESQGDLTTAFQKRKQINKLLQELTDAQARQVGQGTEAEGQAAYAEWERLNKKIIESLKAEQALVEARRDANQDRLAEEEAILNIMRSTLEDLGDMSVTAPDTEERLTAALELLQRMTTEMASMAALSELINPGGNPATASNINPGNLVGGGVGFAVGTDYVPETGLALIHQGEMIIPAEEAAAIRAARQEYTGSDEYRVKQARSVHSSALREGYQTFDSASHSLTQQRNAGNIDAGRELVDLRLEYERWVETMKEAGKQIKQAEDEVRDQTTNRKKMAENERHLTELADIRERRSKEALDRAESAQRVRELEQEAQVTRDRLAAGPESTPDYIARRRNEIVGRNSSLNKGWQDGYEARQNISDEDAYAAHRGLEDSIEGLGQDYTDLQSKIVDEIEKTHEMVNETKSKLTDKGHEREKLHQNKKAGLDLENQGWKMKGGGSGGSYTTGESDKGDYVSPETQAVEARLERERARQAQLNRARQLSGQSLDQRSAAEAQDAVKMEESMKRSAAQKAYMESLKAVKEAEVLSAKELAAALERSAAAKATLEATGVGAGSGGGDSGSGLVGSFAVGTAYVPKTGLALIHKGEMIIPASMADEIRSGSVGGQAGSSSQDVVSRLDRVLSKHFTPLSRHIEQLSKVWRGGGSRQSSWLEYAEASRRAMEANPNPGYLGDMPIPKNEYNPIPNQNIPMPHRGYNVTANGLGGMRPAGAGGGGGSYTTVNNTMQATMVPASPNSVFAAMATAAQINNIRRR